MKKVFSRKSTVAVTLGGVVPKYDVLLEKISDVFATGQRHVAQAVNSGIVKTYWEIGHHIVEFEQGGNIRAKYGEGLLKHLSRDLRARHGKGFSHSNLIYTRIAPFSRSCERMLASL